MFQPCYDSPVPSAGPTIGNLTCFLGEAVLLEELVQLSLRQPAEAGGTSGSLSIKIPA